MKQKIYNENAAALNWEIVNEKNDIGDWILWYEKKEIKGCGFEEFINAAMALSSNINVIFVKRLKWFIHLARNFMSFKDKAFFANGEKEFFHIEINDFIELRNWDNFWKKIEDGEEFLKRLDLCRTYYNHGESGQRGKNKLSLKNHYKFTLAKEMWRDVYNMNYLYQPWARNYCVELLPQDEEEYELMSHQFFCKSGFYYLNFDHLNKVVDKINAYDISSAFLSYLFRKPFPMEHFTKTSDIEEIQRIVKDKYHCWYGVFDFYGVEYNSKFEFDICRFGQRLENVERGFRLLLTNVDMEWFKKALKWEGCICHQFYYTRQRVLPKGYIQMLSRLYDTKYCQKKGTFAKEISKFRAELVFGQPIKAADYPSKTVYVEETNNFEIVENEEKSFSQVKNDLSKRGIPMYVGLWTAAYARQEFYNLLSKIGFDNVIYGDTDSVWFTGEEGIKVIEEHNKTIQKEKDEIRRRYSVIGREEMGQWLCEGKVRIFKAIEKKWYTYEKYNEQTEEWDLVVKAAGADADKIKDFLLNKKKSLSSFNIYMKVPEMRYTIKYDETSVSLVYEEDIDRQELLKQRKLTNLYKYIDMKEER